jgi:peptidyl-prolyl cis-trans isomerase SurA
MAGGRWDQSSRPDPGTSIRHIFRIECLEINGYGEKIMRTSFTRRRLFLFVTRTVLLLPLVVSTAKAEILTADGQAITEDDIVQRTRLNALSTHKQSERQDVLNELAGEKRNIREAEGYGIYPSDEDVDRAFVQMCSRMRITPEQLTKSLGSRGIRPDTLKQRIKADIARVNLAHLLHYKF